jgi:hypothetical protein
LTQNGIFYYRGVPEKSQFLFGPGLCLKTVVAKPNRSLGCIWENIQKYWLFGPNFDKKQWKNTQNIEKSQSFNPRFGPRNSFLGRGLATPALKQNFNKLFDFLSKVTNLAQNWYFSRYISKLMKLSSEKKKFDSTSLIIIFIALLPICNRIFINNFQEMFTKIFILILLP